MRGASPLVCAWAVLMTVGAWPALGAGPATSRAGALEVRVDRRVELLSVVFRLAGHPEYNMANSKSRYADDVEGHFGRFREHPVVKEAKALRSRRGVSYDAVMNFAMHLEPDVSPPRMRVPLEPRPSTLEARWTVADAAKFTDLLAAFVDETGFQAFFDRHAALYAVAAERLGARVNERDHVAWFDRFFGARPEADFAVIVGMLNGGGSYAVSVQRADGRVEITPVIGMHKWDGDGRPVVDASVLPTVVHEFAHAYVNAIIDRHYERLEKAGNALFDSARQAMQRQAYGSGKIVLYESLVRACVTLYMFDELGPAAGKALQAQEVARGFRWTPGLVELLREYQSHREAYASFDDFMPRIADYFAQAATEAGQLAAKTPRVVSIVPVNGATDVDAATVTEVVITFDRPMTDGNWSIVGGGPSYPDFGQPAYDAQRRVLRVPVRLEPGKAYRFSLNSDRFRAFQSAEGIPLEPFEVSFSTRAVD